MPKKRYHQSATDRRHEREGMLERAERMRRDRLDEREGMLRHETRLHRDRAEGMRRSMERMVEKDEYGVKRSVVMHPNNEYDIRHGSHGLIDEDRHEVANLPQRVVYRPYGDPVDYLPQAIDDTIIGIDNQRGMDYRKARESWNPRKV